MNTENTPGAGGIHGAIREDLGAYALGLLGAEEHDRVSEHLAGCAGCRAELSQIAPLAPLLRQVEVDRVTASAPDAGPELTPQLEQAIANRLADSSAGSGLAEVIPIRGYRRRLIAIAGVAAVAVLVAGVGGFTLGQPPTKPFEPVSVVAAGPVPATATAGVIPHTWGMEIRLTASGFAAGQRYVVSVRDAAGAQHAAGEFVGTGANPMVCNLNSSVLRPDADGFTVVDDQGEVVLSSSF